MRAQDLKNLAGPSYTVEEAYRITGSRHPDPSASVWRNIVTARTNNPEVIGVIESLPDGSIARYFDGAEPQFEVFDGYYGDNKKNFSQRVHERRALSAIINRHKERTGQAGPQASFMAEGRYPQHIHRRRAARARSNRYRSGRANSADRQRARAV